MMHVENRLALEAFVNLLFWLFVIGGVIGGWLWMVVR